jgi:hypothetical protein
MAPATGRPDRHMLRQGRRPPLTTWPGRCTRWWPRRRCCWPPRPWTAAEIKSIGAFAFVIGRLLGVTSEARHMGDLATQLQGALDSRILIEQAKGVLMERDGLSDLEAFDRLRRQARSRSSTINDVAREIIANRALGAARSHPAP